MKVDYPTLRVQPLIETSLFRADVQVGLQDQLAVHQRQSGPKSRGRIDRGRGFVKGAIRVPMGSSGRYRCRPLPLVSVSYGFPAHCHGGSGGFEQEIRII
jgi:hypothetical protein